jgi:signal recognition particle GTPase
MATRKESSHHHYYQIAPPIIPSKLHSQSSDSLPTNKPISESQEKPSKMKKSQTTLTGFDIKPVQTSLNSTSVLRRRFSLFRMKRSPQANENCNVQALQQTIDQLRRDLQIKTDELEVMREHIEDKRSNMIQASNECSIEQAMQLQTMLNARLEEMLIENDVLKKSIQELESYVQQEKSKRKVQFH